MRKNKRSSPADNFVLIRGGGDLASGVALRLHRAGIKIVIAELPQPLSVRRAVSFAEAVYEGHHEVEGVMGKLIEADQLSAWKEADAIPVIVNPDANILLDDVCIAVVDARLIKHPPAPLPTQVPLHIGLGPGFCAGSDCHAVIETRRSHTLGRVYWTGSAQPDSGQPEGDPRRVLRAPVEGVIIGLKKIGEHVQAGEELAVISESANSDQRRRGAVATYSVISPFAGVLRGLIRDGVHVSQGLKIGDVDARDDASACFLVSDKALAIGGGVLEALLSKPEIRREIFS